MLNWEEVQNTEREWGEGETECSTNNAPQRQRTTAAAAESVLYRRQQRRAVRLMYAMENDLQKKNGVKMKNIF